jgi:PPK2 family polyphosphate:nucleotide phosphotransferase
VTRHPEAIALCRVPDDGSFRLADHPTDWVGTEDLPKARKDLARERAEEVLEENRRALVSAQEKLWANDTYAVLAVFQAMDAAGKDGTIKHVMSGVNPQGVDVTSFKVPSAEELDHHFLWRYAKAAPERGRIGIFNRSYYEEVLVVRVHPEVLDGQQLPASSRTPRIWEQRYEDINAFERHLDRNGVKVVKFFLHLSRDEQKERFLSRIDAPAKNWKFSAADVRERRFWDDYQGAYDEAIRATSTEWAPWYVIPADRKWLMRALVSEVLVDVIDRLPIGPPELPEADRAELAAAREELLAD